MKKYLIILISITLFTLGFAEGESVKIVSLAPAITEMIYYLGVENTLSAVTSACDYPEEAKKKPKAGDFTMPDMEKIISIKPNYVLAMDLNEKKMEKFKQFGITAINYKVKTVDDIVRIMEEINKITGNKQIGKTKIEDFKNRLKNLENKISKNSKKPKVFIMIWNAPLMTAGKSSIVSDIVVKAGGKNIADTLDAEYPEYGRELLYSENPDFYLAEPKTEVSISGIKIDKKKIINDISGDYFLRPGPRVLLGIEKLNERFDKN